MAGVLVCRPGKTRSLYKAIEERYGVSKKVLKAELSCRGYEKVGGLQLASVLQEHLAAITGQPVTQNLIDLIPGPTFHPENLNLVRALRSQYKTAIVANSDGLVEERLIRAGVRDLFDVVIDSEVVGCRKPDARIYELAAERLGCYAQHCVFVDDKQENVEAARNVGMMAVRYSVEDGDNLAERLAVECGVAVPVTF